MLGLSFRNGLCTIVDICFCLHISGSSNGDFLSTVSGSPYVGGQCEDGLKMILAVVDTHETKSKLLYIHECLV